MTTRSWWRTTPTIYFDNTTPPTGDAYALDLLEDDGALSPETTISRMFLDLSLSFSILTSEYNNQAYDFPYSLGVAFAAGVKNDGDTSRLIFTDGLTDRRVVGTGVMDFISATPSIGQTTTTLFFRTSSVMETQGQRKSTDATKRPRPIVNWRFMTGDFNLGNLSAWFMRWNCNWRVLHQDPS